MICSRRQTKQANARTTAEVQKGARGATATARCHEGTVAHRSRKGARRRRALEEVQRFSFAGAQPERGFSAGVRLHYAGASASSIRKEGLVCIVRIVVT